MCLRALAPCFAAATLLTACGASYDVVRTAEPSPFSCETSFVVLPIAYPRVQVGKKTETDYLSAKGADTRQSWETDKQAIDREFRRRLVRESADKGIHVDASSEDAAGRFFIRPTVRFLEPGFYAGPARHTSEVRMTVAITTADGRVLDELELESKTMGSVAHATTHSRFVHDGDELGGAMAEYLHGRVGAPACVQQTAQR